MMVHDSTVFKISMFTQYTDSKYSSKSKQPASTCPSCPKTSARRQAPDRKSGDTSHHCTAFDLRMRSCRTQCTKRRRHSTRAKQIQSSALTCCSAGAVLVRQNTEWSQGHLGDTDDAPRQLALRSSNHQP